MSAVMYPWQEVLQQNVTLVFESIKVEIVCLLIFVLYLSYTYSLTFLRFWYLRLLRHLGLQSILISSEKTING